MALMTMIARVVDGLPLVATMQEDIQSGSDFDASDYQHQAKLLFRKIKPTSPKKCTIETGEYLFHYIIHNDVCYLVLCDKMFSKCMAFNFLENISEEFHKNYGRKVNSVTRPYAFIEFDLYIQKVKKTLTDRRRNIDKINVQLYDIQRIMVQNIDDILKRDEAITQCINSTNNLKNIAKKYNKATKDLNKKGFYAKAGLIVLFLFILISYICLKLRYTHQYRPLF